MKFKSPLTEATLLKRHFQFLVDVYLKNRRKQTLYCPNLGLLTHCDVLGSRIWFSQEIGSSPRYLDVWELVEVDGGWLACINPTHANKLIREALHLNKIPELLGFYALHSMLMADGIHRLDVLMKENGEKSLLYVEPVLLADNKNNGYFPEKKHQGISVLRELITLRESGQSVALLYCVQHNGIRCVRPADNIDPLYGKVLREAVAKGVEVLAYRVNISLQEMNLGSRIPVLLAEDIVLP